MMEHVSPQVINTAPIALFVYNRPQHTYKTVEALLKNAEAVHSDLYIFSDAAKSREAEFAVNQVRKYIHKISGFKSINIVEREKNWGLANSIIDGVTKLCNEYGKVIVLEDDLLVSPHFLNFMNNGLELYKNEPSVMQIAGYMFPASLSIDDDALFLPFISSWGWATWSRAWRSFDATASNFQKLKGDKELVKRFNLNGNYDYFKMLKSQQSGKTESWAIRWYLSVFFLNGLTLYPKKTLVENNGFDGTGENCLISDIRVTTLDNNFKVMKLPKSIKLSSHIYVVYKALPRPQAKFTLIKAYIKRCMRLNLNKCSRI